MSDLLQRLREATGPLHGELEGHAVMQRILGGDLSRGQYCMYLRNLLPIYRALEQGLAACGNAPALTAFNRPALFRSDAIARDLLVLAGPAWEQLEIVPSALSYAKSLLALVDVQPVLLGAHAYVRYLGDLSGGRVVRSKVASALALDTVEDMESGLAFYAFSTAPGALAQQLRVDLEQLSLAWNETGAFVAEAVCGFERHRTLFDELEAHAAQSPPLN